MSSELKQMLLAAPDTQLDAQMFPLIEKWDEPNPTSLQILEVLDQCIFASLASGFVVSLLQTLYDARLVSEGRTHEDNVPLATWRSQQTLHFSCVHFGAVWYNGTMYSCQCHQIGGPFIAEDPDCPAHGLEAQREAGRRDRLISELDAALDSEEPERIEALARDALYYLRSL